MKKVFLLFIAAFLGLLASGQKVFFIYLQTEDQTPFFVRMGDKIYSSAASGYLILPNLVDSTYNFSFGFAKSTDSETKFSVAINQKDRGFLVKKFDDDLSLFDFEELTVVKSSAAPKDNTVYETKTDAFSTVLSKAASDPSIVKVAVAKKEEPVKPKAEPEKKEDTNTLVKNEEAKPAEKMVIAPEVTSSTAKPDSPTATTSQEEKTAKADGKEEPAAKVDTAAALTTQTQDTPAQQPAETKTETPVQESTYKPSVIVRRSESSTTEGFGLVYFDKAGDITDTIRILIPSSKVKLISETETNSAVETTPEKEKTDPPAVVEKPAETASAAKENIVTNESATVNKMEEKSACGNLASDKDFLKLRKKMAAKENDDEMIAEARKEFKSKCYTAEQIRYLSTLFLTSAAKYQFFDAAYQHVSDPGNFASLGSEIKDDYYLKRFKALVGE